MGHNEIDAGQSSCAADQHRSKPAQEKRFQVNQPYLSGLLWWLHVYLKHILDVMAFKFWEKVP